MVVLPGADHAAQLEDTHDAWIAAIVNFINRPPAQAVGSVGGPYACASCSVILAARGRSCLPLAPHGAARGQRLRPIRQARFRFSVSIR